MKKFFEYSLFFIFLTTISCSSTEWEEWEEEDGMAMKDGFLILKNDNRAGADVTNTIQLLDVCKGTQGGDAYNNYFCQYKNEHTGIYITDLKTGNIAGNITLNSLGASYHCNNADFGPYFYAAGDEFPLLYTSQQGGNARCILADRIFKKDGKYTSETVQRIELPYEDERPLQFTPDAIIDKDGGFIYVYTGNTKPITDFYIYQFRLPDIKEGDTVKLKKEDIISKWAIFGDPAFYKQGGTIWNGNLYVLEGIPRGGADNILRIINLKECKYKTVNLTKTLGAQWEPEDLFLYEGNLYAAGIGTNGGIYQLVFSK